MLLHDQPDRGLGGALAWARRHGLADLHLLVESPEHAGVHARRATAFAVPPSVWVVDGRALRPAEPAPPPSEPDLPLEAAAFEEVIRAAGAEPVVEWGVLRGEVLGLEVCRVVFDDDGAAWLEVGVGKHDRYAHNMLHAGIPTTEALARAVAAVRAARTAAAHPNEMQRLGAERWLRAVLVRRPELVGAAGLEPVSPPVPRGDLRLPVPAPARGTDLAGRPVLVVCSTGVDVELVPLAAEARHRDGRLPRMVLAVPRRDDHPVTRDLAGALAEPAEVVAVPDDWRTLAP